MQLTSTFVFLAVLASGGSRVFSLPMGADVTDLDGRDVELDLEARDYDADFEVRDFDADFEARDYADFEVEARDFEEVDSTVKASSKPLSGSLTSTTGSKVDLAATKSTTPNSGAVTPEESKPLTKKEKKARAKALRKKKALRKAKLAALRKKHAANKVSKLESRSPNGKPKP
ncbi:hypothetical protein K443DRAFT_16059, partial [Laccaria amethystina LaAM-08-1]